MEARWTALVLAVTVWGAVLVAFSVRITRFVLTPSLKRTIGTSILKVVASLCLLLLYLGSPFGQDIAFFMAYGLISSDRSFHLDWPLYSWIAPSIGVVSLIVTTLLVRRKSYENVLQIRMES